MITSILARSKNKVIGNNNALPWRSKEDMKFFKSVTTGKVVVMGFNTFKSLGFKPLKDRMNIIIVDSTRSFDINDYDINEGDVLFIPDNGAVNFVKRLHFSINKDIFIIGGKRTYQLFEDLVNSYYISEGNFEVEGDTSYDPDLSNFNLLEASTRQLDDKFTLHYYIRMTGSYN